MSTQSVFWHSRDYSHCMSVSVSVSVFASVCMFARSWVGLVGDVDMGTSG